MADFAIFVQKVLISGTVIDRAKRTEIHGYTWYFMYSWLFFVTRGYLWLYVVICNYKWVFVVIRGYLWLFVVICGYSWLLLVIHGYSWLLVVIRVLSLRFLYI